ncbi:MAG: beta-galactosidase trimerization domain-containing protein [Armatimonadota bacterium]
MRRVRILWFSLIIVGVAIAAVFTMQRSGGWRALFHRNSMQTVTEPAPIDVPPAIDAGAVTEEEEGPIAAASFRKSGQAVEQLAGVPILCEAEEFHVDKPGWRARGWGTNYFSGPFANTFLSRKAYLSAPPQADTAATINVNVKEAGRYLVLARYEAPYRFEAQFRVKVAQGGKTVLDRLYGARKNTKVWAFGNKLTTEVAWDWGASENVVWEGHDAYAQLKPGKMVITLTAGKQPEPAGKRNVDLIMLTTDEAQVQERIQKEGYLPLDGMLTQAGDVFMRVKNTGSAPLAVKPANMTEHSPYWVHTRTWPAVSIDVPPGKTSDWVDVGGLLDTMNDGQWDFTTGGASTAEIGVKNAAGKIEKIGEFKTADGNLKLAVDADTRYTRRIRTQDGVIRDLLAAVNKQPKRGTAPSKTLIYAITADPGAFKSLYGIRATEADDGYVDWRGQNPQQLQESCAKLGVAAKNIRVVSLGDEITLPGPADGDAGFAAFLKANGVRQAFAYSNDTALKGSEPARYYWCARYRNDYGIRQMKALTDVLRRNLPNAGIGANYSPHHGMALHAYLGEVHKWVTCFREDGMTLPWSEDYIWQLPVGSPQMNGINLELFRAGNRGKPERDILYYVMAHSPGNTPNMWRRLFHNAVGHGMTVVNLFEFRPVTSAYTENHVTGDAMYAMVLKTFRELSFYEDIVQDGGVRPAEAGLWFSETGDIWGDNEGSFAAAKRALYVAIKGRQLPLDVIVEQDALDGTLGKYKVLYLTDNHVSQAASKRIAEWVNRGGVLFATAGAGMFDETNKPNTILRKLLGVEESVLTSGDRIAFIKQDLPFAKAVGEVTLTEPVAAKIPVFGAVSQVKTSGGTVIGTFAGGSPAVVQRKVGKGRTIYCAFLPGLSYFQPAIPRLPVDRGSTDSAMTHFIPTKFDPAVGKLVGMAAAGVTMPVDCSEPLVEANVIESKRGTAIVLTNWSATPKITGLRVKINIPARGKPAMASGMPVKTEKGADGKLVYVLDLNLADVLLLR